MSRDPRWGRLTRWVARAGPGAFSLFWLLFWVSSRNPAFALLAAGLVTGAVLSVVVAVGRTAWGSRPVTERQLGRVVGLFGLPGGLMAALLLVAFGVPLPWAAAAGVSVGGAMAAYYS